MPVIKKFWYNPDSGIIIVSFELLSWPIMRCNLEISVIVWLVFLVLLFLKNLIYTELEINIVDNKKEMK